MNKVYILSGDNKALSAPYLLEEYSKTVQEERKKDPTKGSFKNPLFFQGLSGEMIAQCVNYIQYRETNNVQFIIKLLNHVGSDHNKKREFAYTMQKLQIENTVVL